MKPQLVVCLLLATRALQGGEIAGRVTLDGRPAAGITVHAFPFETTEEEMRRLARRLGALAPVASAVSDAKWEYRLVFDAAPGAPGRLVWVSVAGGRGTAARHVSGVFDTSEREELDEIALAAAARVFGRGVDARGAPVSGADVFLGGISYPLASMRTGPDGAFAFEAAAGSGNIIEITRAGTAGARANGVSAGAARTLVLTKPAVLSGTVRAPGGGAPVAGALLRAEAAEGVPAFAESDAEGRFSLIALPAGRVRLSVRAGAAGARDLASVPSLSPPEKPLSVALLPLRALAGRVFDGTAQTPLAGARVRVFERGGRGPVLTTDASGRWSAGAADAATSVTVSAPRFVSRSRDVPAGDATFDVFLRKGASLAGRVTDDAGRPVGGARVRAAGPFEESGRRVAAARTLADGTFTVRGVSPSAGLTVRASSPDFLPAAKEIALAPGEARTGLTLTLKRGLEIGGVVTDAAGAPVAAVEVLTDAEDSGGDLVSPVPVEPLRTVTGREGRFILGGLSPGEHLLRFSKPGFAKITRAPVRVAASGAPRFLRVVLAPEADLRGRVVGRLGGPGAAERVYVRASTPLEGESTRLVIKVAAGGEFEVAGLRQGAAYDISDSETFGSEGTRKGVVAPADGVRILTRGCGRLTGRVLDAAGHPVSAFRIALQPGEKESAGPFFVEHDVSSDEGIFDLDDAPAGELAVDVSAAEFREAFVTGVVVEELRTRKGIEVRLDPGVTLKGRVVDAASGQPVAEAVVQAESAESVTDADGLFSLRGVPSGKVFVLVRHPDYVVSRETVPVGDSGGSVELRLASGGTVSAVVVSAAGGPAPGARASVSTTGAWASSVADDDGRVTFRHLPPGRYRLFASDGKRAAKNVDFVLGDGELRDDLRAVLPGDATTLRVGVSGLTPEERTLLSVFAWGENRRAPDAGPDGRLEFGDVPPGTPVTVYASVSPPGNTAGPVASRSIQKNVVAPEAGGSLDVDVVFEPGYRLAARLTRGGAGVAGASVTGSSAVGGVSVGGVTDASGSCTLAGLPAGALRVTASSSGLFSASVSRTVELSGDQALDLEIPTGRIAGRVVAAESGEALAAVELRAYANAGDDTPPYGMTDSGGRFVLENVPPGARTLTATLKGRVADPMTVDQADPAEVVLEMRRQDGLEVRARDAQLGTPIGGVFVRLADRSGRAAGSMWLPLDLDGIGEVPSVPPGVYSVVVSTSGYAPIRIDGVVVPGSPVSAALVPGGTLTVNVAPERIAKGPLACRFTQADGEPLRWSAFEDTGRLSVAEPLRELRDFPAGAGTLSCPGSPPIPFVVTEGGWARIAVK